MSLTKQSQIKIRPMISYPREAQVGKTYLMTIDLEALNDPADWPYEEEEYPVSFILDTLPLFSNDPVGNEDSTVILHRFGGTYGPATFLLTAASEEVTGMIKVTLVNDWGIPIEQVEVKSKVSLTGVAPVEIVDTRRVGHEMRSEAIREAIEKSRLNTEEAQVKAPPPREDQDKDVLDVSQSRLIFFPSNPMEYDYLGRVIKGRYKLLHDLRRDSFAVTYIARDLENNAIYALKVMHQELTDDGELLTRFQREAHILFKLNDPHIVRLIDYGQDNTIYFIVMEYVDGQNLKYHMLTDGPMEPLRALKYTQQVVEGLETTRRQGVVHRDIRPQNILINSQDEVKITDFGLAGSRSAVTLTGANVFMGTAYYIAPEQAESGRAADIRSDLYSLAVVLFEMLIGRPPFEGETAVDIVIKHMNDNVPLMRRLRPELPIEADSFMQRALAKSPQDRYQTPQEFLTALKRLQKILLAERIDAVEDKPGQQVRSEPNIYRLIDERGRGSFATVYIAVDIENRIYAIKVMHRELASDDELRARFQREAHILLKLNDPRIVKLIDYGQDNNSHFIVMEYVDGQNLKYYMVNEGPMESVRAVNYTKQVVEGLDAVYKQGVVHRSIQPKDVLVNNKEMVKIVDFGLARGQEFVTLTQDNIFMGTAYYIAPEQAESGRAADIRSDLYSLAVVLFEMLIGRPPFEGETAVDIVIKHMNEKIPSICQLRPELPPEMDLFMQRALAKSPQDRYQTPQEFLIALEQVEMNFFSILQDQKVDNRVYSSQPLPQSSQPLAMQENMQCPRCGTPRSLEDKFCTNCGYSFQMPFDEITITESGFAAASLQSGNKNVVEDRGFRQFDDFTLTNPGFPSQSPQEREARIDYTGRVVGEYYLLREIGSGSTGRVYLAEHMLRKYNTVAIKLLPAQRTSQEKRNRVLQEAQLLNHVNHPYILPILEVGVHEDVSYIVTEYAPNGSLRDRLRQLETGLMPIQASLNVLTQIGEALHYIHKQNIIHRDVKPSNILFNERGEALLTDFGIAIVRDPEDTKADVAGTLAYMAPEQFQGSVNQRIDQYALGCVAYELFTGRKPFTAYNYAALMMMHMRDEPMSLRELNPDVPEHIERAVLKAMAKNPDNRHRDVLAFIKALLSFD